MKFSATAQAVIADLKALADAKKAAVAGRFFKTGPGQYGEGDLFWGITVPKIRSIVKKYTQLDLHQKEIEKLLRHEVHEVRLCAVLMLVATYRHDPAKIYHCYLKNLPYINNWDLIDSSAEHILGPFLEHREKKILLTMAASKNIWERRVAIVSTFHDIKKGHPETTLQIAALLVNDRHDLIQKAVGWMLREIGKRCSPTIEKKFLGQYAATMPRTMLRYAIERFPEAERKYYLGLKQPPKKAMIEP